MKWLSETADKAATRRALALIAVFALARAAFAATLGPGYDEAYTIVVARRLALSYFDHPPLHQWIAHFAALIFGEGAATRTPFIALFAATGWLIFALTRHLFGVRAGLVALVALNVSPFFFASAGAWVVPDGPLLFALAGAALALTPLFFGEPGRRAAWVLWLAAGFCLGLAGLSKYNAALFPVGLAAFVALSPRQRRWLAHPAPYAAALLALVMVSPVFVWNASHAWVSFAFQGERGALGHSWRPWGIGAMALGEAAYLGPWIVVPLVGALVAAARQAFVDERRLFLLCLALPPIVVFTLTPLWGARGLPHWPAPGWLFAFPLLGAWLVEPWAARRDLRRWAIAAAALTGALALLVVTQAATGWATRLFPLPVGAVDPTLETLDWGLLRRSPAIAGDATFVVTTRWAEGGKIGLALGPGTPILAFSDDPRGLAFLDDSAGRVGDDGTIVVPWRRLAETLARLRPYFAVFDAPERVMLRRGGQDEIELAVTPAHGLTRAFPAPYPR